MGRCVIRNGKESTMATTVFVDFLSGYLVNEYGRQALFELPAYGGANCAVRMSTLRGLGGWEPHNLNEDTPLPPRVRPGGQRVRQELSPPEFGGGGGRTQGVWEQRDRLARGHPK